MEKMIEARFADNAWYDVKLLAPDVSKSRFLCQVMLADGHSHTDCWHILSHRPGWFTKVDHIPPLLRAPPSTSHQPACPSSHSFSHRIYCVARCCFFCPNCTRYKLTHSLSVRSQTTGLAGGEDEEEWVEAGLIRYQSSPCTALPKVGVLFFAITFVYWI